MADRHRRSDRNRDGENSRWGLGKKLLVGSLTAAAGYGVYRGIKALVTHGRDRDDDDYDDDIVYDRWDPDED